MFAPAKAFMNNNIKKAIIICCIIVLILFLFINCKKENDKTITINIVCGSVGSDLDLLKNQIGIFEKQNPGIKIITVESPESQTNQYDHYVNLLKNKDSGIDIYIIDLVWTPEFGNNEWLLPLNDYIKKDNMDISDFFEGLIKAGTWKNNIIGLPWFTDAGVLYYRKDLLEKYGYKVPKTWEELEVISEKITKSEKKEHPHMVGFVFQGDRYEGLVTNYLEYLWSYGGDVLNDSGEVIINDEKSVKALDKYCHMLNISSPGAAAFQEEDGRNYFQSGNSVFMRNWPYAWKLMADENSQVKGKFSIAPVPGGISTLGGWQLGVSSYSKHPYEAFKFIEFLTSTEQQVYKAVKAGHNPTRKSSYKDERLVDSPYIKNFHQILIKAHPRPVHPKYNEISIIIQEEVHKTLKGKITPEIATKNMEEKIKIIIAEQEK